MSSQSKKVKNEILASKISVIRSLNNEQALKYELTLFFQNLKKSVLSELEEYYNFEFMFQAHADLILAPIFEAQQEYYNILRKFNHKEYKFGRKTGRRLVKLARKKAKKGSLTYADKASKTPSILNATIKKDELFDTNPWSEQKLLNQTFTASERTMNRIDSDINKILSDGYRNGKGINVVRNDITKRFDQLSSWEATRIARTEIHNAHNMGTMDIYQEMGVEYTQWIAAHDSRTRTSHLDVDREIIPMGGTYSNGLRYPGDTTGPLKEWINCRCSNAPFIIPDGYIAPSFAPFKEEDLIPTSDYYNQEFLEDIQRNSDIPANNLKTTLKKTNSKNKKLTSDIKSNIENKFRSYSKIPPRLNPKKNNNIYAHEQKYKSKYGQNAKVIPYRDIVIIQKERAYYVDISTVKRGYDKLPKSIKKHVKTIVINEKAIGDGTIQGSVLSLKSSIINLYPTKYKPLYEYDEVIWHESGHVYDSRHLRLYSISKSLKWLRAVRADRKHIKKQGFIPPNSGLVSPYAEYDYNKRKFTLFYRRYAEDFAESVRMYISKDPTLRAYYPNRYNLLKEILGDVNNV